jgi:hypothetical protein
MSNLLTVTNLSRISIYLVTDNNCNKNSIILHGCTKITKERNDNFQTLIDPGNCKQISMAGC